MTTKILVAETVNTIQEGSADNTLLISDLINEVLVSENNASIVIQNHDNDVTINQANNVINISQPAMASSVTIIGSSIASAGATVTIGIASATVIAANTSRKGLIVTNTHASNTLTIDLSGGAAVALRGIVLYPHDSFVMDAYTFTTNLIKGIGSAAGTTVAVQEMT